MKAMIGHCFLPLKISVRTTCSQLSLPFIALLGTAGHRQGTPGSGLPKRQLWLGFAFAPQNLSNSFEGPMYFRASRPVVRGGPAFSSEFTDADGVDRSFPKSLELFCPWVPGPW